MSYQKKDLFTIKRIPEENRKPIQDADRYPPTTIKWHDDAHNEVLTCLGESNKTDLVDKRNFPGDEEVEKAFKNNMIKQFLYVNNTAEMFEVVIIQTESNDMFVVAIRTRRRG